MFDFGRPNWERSRSSGGQANAAQAADLRAHYAAMEGNSWWDNSKNGFQRAGMWAADAAINPSAHLVPNSLSTAMGKHGLTRTLAKTAAEAVGFDYDLAGTQHGKNWGWLGAGHYAQARKDIAGGASRLSIAGSIGKGVLATAAGAFSIYDTASLVSEGYNKGGLFGAAGGFGQAMAWQYAGRTVLAPAILGLGKGVFGGAIGGYKMASGAFLGSGLLGGGMGAAVGGIGAALTNPVTLALGIGAMGYYGYQREQQKTNRAIGRYRQIKNLEMGGPIQDQFGTIATLRQRSLQAIQNTHVNGRLAFGQEASILHQ